MTQKKTKEESEFTKVTAINELSDMEETAIEYELAAAEEHRREIESSRVGGFGGSDAKMIYKVGLKGLSSLNNSDKVRIRVAKGLTPYKAIQQTAAMEKGHAFEDWFATAFEKRLHNFSREMLMSAQMARNFKTFAHADFATHDGKNVIELKCIADIKDADKAYMEQLQWYHMLGAEKVALVVCNSFEVDFEKGLQYPIEIERNEGIIDILRNGIKLLDDNWNDLDLRIGDEWNEEDLFPAEQREVAVMTSYLRDIEILQKAVEDRKAKLFNFMEKNNIKAIKSDAYDIIYVPAGQTSCFDKAKLLKDHPEINEQDYTKMSERKAYLTIKLKA